MPVRKALAEINPGLPIFRFVPYGSVVAGNFNQENARQLGIQSLGPLRIRDAFHPSANWYNPDVIGINLGISLLMAENLRTQFVWNAFISNPECTGDATGGIQARIKLPVPSSYTTHMPSCL